MVFSTVGLFQTVQNQNSLTQNSNTPAGGKCHPSQIMSYKYSFCFYCLLQKKEIFEVVCYPADMEAIHQYIEELTVI